jgi:leader peptidase (prepilin peptidase) / N-methyltransferase
LTDSSHDRDTRLGAWGQVLRPGLAAWWGEPVSSAEVLAFVLLGLAAIPLFVIDIREHRLPNAIVLPLYPIGLLLLSMSAAASGDWLTLRRALVAMFVALIIYSGLALLRRSGMGMGDVKLSGVLGLYLGYLGWGQFVVGMVTAFVLGSVFGMALMLARKAHRGTAIPFGPFMLAGAAIGAVAGHTLWAWYLSAAFLTA